LAVTRNKAKRWVREVFREYALGPGFIVVVRKGFIELGFKKINAISRPHLVGFKKPQACL
jgi:ribonuclease P protein component|tara:strand:+ start:4921 stop:5100 length:180 start_codon:yes stop_codon:yes gene_type:complete